MKANTIYLLILVTSLTLLLIGCKKATSDTTKELTTTTVRDTIKPLIMIQPKELEVTIKVGETYNFMQGVTALDNIEGDITDRIEINIGEFDNTLPGEYDIIYSLSDLSGNEADIVTRKVIVTTSGIFQAPPVYLDTISNEKPKPSVPSCFQGAWYHKVVSAKDYWLGIEGTITLPKVTIKRYQNDTYNTELNVDPYAKNLDNPSIYMGGHAQTESDVGLSLSRVLLKSGGISTGGVAFRPFWRYITSTDYDEGGYDVHDNLYAVSCTGSTSKNCIANWHFSYTEFYYLPGDKIRMLVYSPKPNYLQMQIEVIEKSTLPESVQLRIDNDWKDPEDFISPIFKSPGHGTGMISEYKRVNAIDQVNNEGKPIIYTDTLIDFATWHESYLYRKINDVMYRVPMTENRVGVMNCPITNRFTSTYDNVDTAYGGENIQIHPGSTDVVLIETMDIPRKGKEDF